MDYALTNYMAIGSNSLEVMQKNLNINDLVIDEFLKDLDARKETKETYLKGVKVFLDWCKDNDVHEVVRSTLIQYKEDLVNGYEVQRGDEIIKHKPKKASSISMYITALKKLYKFLESKGIKNIASDLKGAKNSKGFKKDTLTIDQAKDLLKSIDKSNKEGIRNYAIIQLLITTGLRTIELERANIEDIRTIGSQAVLYIQGKGHDDKDEYVKLTYQTLKALNEYLATRTIKSDKEPLFISFSDRTNGQKLKTRSIRDIVKKAYRKIGINSDKITTHSLRHSAITFSLIGGATIQEAQQLARHTNINTTMIYAHNLKRIDNKAEESIQNLLND
jgi:integrase/recombinase XerD